MSDASVGEAGTGIAIAECQRVKFQKEKLLQEKHAGLGEIHGVYEQVKAVRNYEGEAYVTCNCQGLVVALQNADYKTKFRKRIKGAYWNYHLRLNEIMEKREEERKGKMHFIWIQSHMSRKGKLNESHTEQDTRAGETANNKAQHTTHIPIPEEMWSIVDEGGRRAHSRIRKTAEEGVRTTWE